MQNDKGSYEIQLEFLIDTDAIYDALAEAKVSLRTLDQIDPEYLVEKIVECRNHISKVTDTYRRVAREKSRMENLEASIESQYEILKDSKLASDANVRERGSSIEDRKAIINTELVDLKSQLRTAKARTKEITNLEKVVTTIIKNLENVSKDIDKQRRIMELQMHELNRASVKDQSMVHLNQSFNEIREFEKEFESDGVLASDQSGLIVDIPEVGDETYVGEPMEELSEDSNDSPVELPTVELEGEALPPSDSGLNLPTDSEVISIETVEPTQDRTVVKFSSDEEERSEEDVDTWEDDDEPLFELTPDENRVAAPEVAVSIDEDLPQIEDKEVSPTEKLSVMVEKIEVPEIDISAFESLSVTVEEKPVKAPAEKKVAPKKDDDEFDLDELLGLDL